MLSAVLLAVTASVVGAGNIDYISSRSADFLRIMSRNASTEGADLVSFNPAGLVLLPEGWHFNVSSQTLLKDYTVEAVPPPGAPLSESTLYETTEPTPILPNIYAVYRSGRMAGFAAFTVPAGGGKLDFADGLRVLPLFETGLQQAIHGSPYVFALMDSGSIEASSNYFSGTAGVSVEIARGLSAALAARYVSSKRTYDAEGHFTVIDGATGDPLGTSDHELHAEKTASGMSGIISLNYSLCPALNAALRYETATELEFETEAEASAWTALPPLASFEDGYKQRRDLPAVLGTGLEYRSSSRLLASVSMNYYFLENADQGEDDGYDDNYGNGWDAGVGFEYMATPRLDLSAGYLYSDLGGSDTTYNDLEFSLNAHFIGAGASWEATPGLDLTGAVARLVCPEGEGAGTYEGTLYNKSIWYFGVGAAMSIPTD